MAAVVEVLNELFEKDRLSRLEHIRNQLGYLIDASKELKKKLGRRGSHGVGEQGIDPKEIEDDVETMEAHCNIMKDIATYMQGIEWILSRTAQEFEHE